MIDLSDPANPVLKAFLRLPASGQDLYILPGQGSVRYAALLTYDYDYTNYAASTGVKVVKVDGKTATLVSETRLEGWLSDSRSVGNRLFVITQQWNSSTQDSVTLNELLVAADGSLSKGTSHSVSGYSPVISAGSGWLAVSASDYANWQQSFITLFALSQDGAALLTPTPVAVSGRVYDKFKVQYANDTLSVISQNWVDLNDPTSASWWRGTSVTTLDNFNLAGEKVGSLEIVRGEQLYATCFAGNKAYAVTFQQVDPLWVIDLSNPANPLIAGSISVPGYSTHIEPIGDLLFSIGYDQNQVAASLFDVSNPASPALLKRVQIEGTWGSSEALYDDKALKVLPDDGLALIPFTRYTGTGNENFVQLLDLDIAGRDLRQRGTISHDFAPRRAAVVAGSLASISQRELVTADIANRDQPVILSDLLLAWPVDRIVAAGDYLIEIATGYSWSSATPVARIATVANPDSILNEVDLGSGSVRDAVVRDGKLYVLSQPPSQGGIYPVLYLSLQNNINSSPLPSGSNPTLTLSIYDISVLPALKLTGSASAELPGDGFYWEIGALLWPTPTCALSVVQPQSWRYWLYPLPVYSSGVVNNNVASTTATASPKIVSSCVPYPFRSINHSPALAMAFQVDMPTAPTALTPITLTGTGESAVKAATAGDGMLVFGYGDNETALNGSGDLATARHHLRILDLHNPAAPISRPVVDLPGQLFAVSDLTSDGFLAWTETRSSSKENAGKRLIQVGAGDGVDVFQIATLKLSGAGALTTDGRSLYSVEDTTVTRRTLNDAGAFNPTDHVKLDWTPQNLQAIPGGLLGNDWNHFFRAIWSDKSDGNALDWVTRQSMDATLAVPLSDDSVLVPVGDYGVEHLQP